MDLLAYKQSKASGANGGCARSPEPHTGVLTRVCVCVCVPPDQPELKHIDQILVKRAHTAAATFILEAVKQNADSSTLR